MDVKYLLRYEDLIEILIEYYKIEVDTLFPANAKFRIGWWLTGVIYLTSGISMSINMAFLKNIGSVKWLIISVIVLAISILMYLTLLRFRDKYRGRLIKEKFRIEIEKNKKVNECAYMLEMYRLIEFLKDNVFTNCLSISEKEKVLLYIINKLEEKIHVKLTSRLFVPGIFAALFIPAWVEYMDIVFSNISINEAISKLVQYGLFALLISIVIGAASLLRKDIMEMFEKKEKQIIRKVVRTLKDINTRLLCTDEI